VPGTSVVLVAAGSGTPSSQLALLAQASDELADQVVDEIEEADGTLWARGLVGSMNRDETNTTIGFDYESNGVVGGGRTPRFAGFSAGVAVGAINGEAELEQGAGDTNSDGIVAAGYVDWKADGMFAVAGASYGTYDFETTRNVTFNGAAQVVDGESEGSTMSAFAAFGKKFEVGDWRLSASGRVNYTKTDVDAYEENGTSPARIAVEDFEAESFTIGARVRGETEIPIGDDMALLPSAGVGAYYESAMGDRTLNVTFVDSGATDTLEADEDSRFMGEARGGLTLRINQSIDVHTNVRVAIGEDEESVTGTIGARFRF
jgi:uncharacterized protein with beta-barrel porin domain